MSFLSINGVDVPVAMDTYRERFREVTERQTAHDGTTLTGRRVVKRDIEFETPPVADANGVFFEHFLRGEGEWFGLDATAPATHPDPALPVTGTYGAKGTAPTAGGTPATITPDPNVHALVDLGYEQTIYELATGDSLAYKVGTHTNSSMLAWCGTNTDAHLVLDSDGIQYENGVAGSYSVGNFMSYSSGTFTLLGGVTHVFSWALFLPYLVPATYVASIANFMYFSPLPKLYVYGTGVQGAPTSVATGTYREMFGEVETVELIKTANGNYRRLSVKLTEV